MFGGGALRSAARRMTSGGRRNFMGTPRYADVSGKFVSSRIMGPDDANPHGNVHGGQLLRFMTDDAAFVAALRFLNGMNRQSGVVAHPYNAALATLGKTEFLSPVHIGELVEAEAEVVYTSKRSLQIEISLYAENLMTGFRRLSNTATAWFVGLDERVKDDLQAASTIPQLVIEDKERLSTVRKAYLEQLRAREYMKGESQDALLREYYNGDWNAYLAHLLLPTDCFQNNIAQGGKIIKLMDEVGFLSAYIHARAPCVTATMETIRFREPLHRGDLVTLKARPTFTSSKSIEVEIIVRGENPSTGEERIAAHGFFVFVALDPEGKALQVPPLKEYNPLAELRYMERNKRRKSSVQSKL